jgi:predicted GIY-YIG superfamily endonuclease
MRLLQHNEGISKWTAKHRPWILVWQSDELGLSEARKLENLLKRQKGGNGFYQFTGLNPSGS